MKISVLGLGYIGLPTAIIFAKNGFDVMGFDVSEHVVDCLNRGHIHIVETGLQPEFEKVVKSGKFKAYSTLQEANCYIISVPTPFVHGREDKVADMTYVENATKEVAKILKKGDLVVLESTVPPLSTRKMTDMLVSLTSLERNDFYTAHCPERVLPGHILQELIHNDRIIGAEREESAQMAKKMYEHFLKDGKVYTTDDVTAEMCKLVENSFRDVNIAFANELSIISDQLGINVHELISLANKHPRVNILSPGVGVGGHCIAVDPWFIVEKFGSDAKLINTARIVNDSKPFFVANKVEERVHGDKNKVIGVLGLSFKSNIDDFRESPSIILAKELTKRGYKVIGCEPNVQANEVDGIVNKSLDSVLLETDFVVLAQRHDEFVKRFSEIEKKDSLIL